MGNMWQCKARLRYEENRRALGTKDMITFFFQFVSSPIVWVLAVKQNLSQPKLNLLLLWSRSRRILKEGRVKRLLPQSRSGRIMNRKGSSWHALRARNTHLLLTGFDLLHHAKFSFVLSVNRPSTECRPIYYWPIHRSSIDQLSAKCRWTKSYIDRDTSGTTINRVSTEFGFVPLWNN